MYQLTLSLVKLYSFLHKKKFQYPVYSEENLAYVRLKDLMWLAYKMMLGHPMEKGEKDKHIEEHFANQNLEFVPPEGFIKNSTVVLSSGGDLLASRDARPDTTRHLWDEAREFLFNADICCANLETPVVPSRNVSFLPEKMSTKIALNNSAEMFDIFCQGGRGINILSTANNHSLDMGEEGLLETLSFLNKKGCKHTGTASSEDEREDILVVEKNGIRIAFVSYTYAVNGKKIPEGKDYLVNYVRLNKPGVDLSMIERHVKKARLEKNADIIVACLHWSFEFESYPFQFLIETGHRIMDLGVDVIIGNHAHGIQPLEKYIYIDPFSGLEKEGLIAYALGDLVSCTEKHNLTPNSRINNLLRLEIIKGSLGGKTTARISDLKIQPMYFYTKKENGKCVDYKLLNLKHLLDEIDAGTSNSSLSSAEILEVKRLDKLAKKILSANPAIYVSGQ